MASRTNHTILAAYKTLHQRLCKAGLKPRLQRLDNECSDILQEFKENENIDYEKVPPHVHRRNAAERAIRTFKNHFIAGLCSLDKNFPLHLWDKLLEQAEITLNLLRALRLNPKLSVYAQLNGQFDFNQTPIAPPGIRVMAHDKPTTCGAWGPHAMDGWYTGPAMKAYRCYNIWIWETRSNRACNTVSWFPSKLKMPIPSTNDLILASICNITHAFNNPASASPVAPIVSSHADQLHQTTQIVKGIVTKRAPPLQPTRDISEQQTVSQSIPTVTFSQQAPMYIEPDNKPPVQRVEATLTPTTIPNDDDDNTEYQAALPANSPSPTPSVTPTPLITYASITGPAAKQRQRRTNQTNNNPKKQKGKPKRKITPPTLSPPAQKQPRKNPHDAPLQPKQRALPNTIMAPAPTATSV